MRTLNIQHNTDLKIDSELEMIWAEHYPDIKDVIAPLYQKELRKEAVTFLSLNPSLPPKSKEKAKKGYLPDEPYQMIDCNMEKENYLFFNKFYEIGKEFNPWTILDLLYERESSQKDLQSKYNSKNVNERNKKFLQSQINMTFKILGLINPLVVVVANALADKLIHENLTELKIHQEFPTIENGFVYRLNGIPFVIRESRFLGSRFLAHNYDLRNELIEEVKRVLTICQQ